MNMKKRLILLPIEVAAREFDWKLILALRLVSSEFSLLIGPHGFINAACKYTKNFIYLGDDSIWHYTNDTSAKFSTLNTIHENNGSIIAIDEEGDCLYGTRENKLKSLAIRDQVKYLRSTDRVLVWGNWQKTVLQNLNQQSKVPIIVSGHPRVDLTAGLDPAYNKAKNFAANVQNVNEFILVNTNFAGPTNSHRDKKRVIDAEIVAYGGVDTFLPLWRHESTLFLEAIELIREIAKKLPRQKIVLRPHPSESKSTYEAIFSDIANLTISTPTDSIAPWIQNAQSVIHFGCTTGLESSLCGKPTFVFSGTHPTDHQDIRFHLGKPISSAHDFLNHYQNITELKPQEHLSIAVDYVHNILHPNSSFDIISSCIEECHNLIDSSSVINWSRLNLLRPNITSTPSLSVLHKTNALLRKVTPHNFRRMFVNIDRHKWRTPSINDINLFASSYCAAIGKPTAKVKQVNKELFYISR